MIPRSPAQLLRVSVSVVSEVGTGTTFEVSIPMEYKSWTKPLRGSVEVASNSAACSDFPEFHCPDS